MLFEKTKQGAIVKGLSYEEFKCKCKLDSCQHNVINDDLILCYMRLRQKLGPLTITSGYRCLEHNVHMGGSLNSTHLYGKAIDISRVGQLKTKSDAEIRRIFVAAGFNYVYIGTDYIHADVRSK